jgi:hypothetical protein
MGRSAAVVTLVLLLTGCVGVPELSQLPDSWNRTGHDIPSDATVLHVEVDRTEATTWSPSVPCSNPIDCISWDVWFRYEARVLGVVQGSWSGDPHARFAHLQHSDAGISGRRDVYVVLQPASEDFAGKVGVSYIAKKILLRNGHAVPANDG